MSKVLAHNMVQRQCLFDLGLGLELGLGLGLGLVLGLGLELGLMVRMERAVFFFAQGARAQ